MEWSRRRRSLSPWAVSLESLERRIDALIAIAVNLVLATILCRVHGGIGIPEQRGSIASVARIESEADARGDEQLVSFDT